MAAGASPWHQQELIDKVALAIDRQCIAGQLNGLVLPIERQRLAAVGQFRRDHRQVGVRGDGLRCRAQILPEDMRDIGRGIGSCAAQRQHDGQGRC